MELTLTYNKFRSVSGHFGDWVVQRMNTILLLFGTGMVEMVVSLFILRRAAFTFSTARISWSEKVASVLSRSPQVLRIIFPFALLVGWVQLNIVNQEISTWHGQTGDLFFLSVSLKKRNRFPHYFTNKFSMLTIDETKFGLSEIILFHFQFNDDEYTFLEFFKIISKHSFVEDSFYWKVIAYWHVQHGEKT